MIQPFVTFTLKDNDLVRVCAVDTSHGLHLFYQVKVNAGSPIPDYADYPNFSQVPDEYKAQAALILATQRFSITVVDSWMHGDIVERSVGAPYSFSVNYGTARLLQEQRWFVPSIGQAHAMASVHDSLLYPFSLHASKYPGLHHPDSVVSSSDYPGMCDPQNLNLEDLIPWNNVSYHAQGLKFKFLRKVLTSRAIATKALPQRPDTLAVPAWDSQKAFALMGEGGWDATPRRFREIPNDDPLWATHFPQASPESNSGETPCP